MNVTASALYDLVQCPQRVALDAFGDPSNRNEINPFVRLLWERGTLFEREIISKLQLPFVDLSRADGVGHQRSALWRSHGRRSVPEAQLPVRHSDQRQGRALRR